MWLNIDILLKKIWEEDYLQQNKYTTSMVMDKIIDWKTYTYSKILLSTLTVIGQLRNSSKNLWKEILSNLIVIKENTKYARIYKKEEQRIISEYNNWYDADCFNKYCSKYFIVRNSGRGREPEILPFGEDAGEISGISKEETNPRTIAILEESPKPKGNFLPRERVLDTNCVGRAVTTSLNQMPMISESTYKLHRTDEIREHKGSPTLTANMGTGGNNQPMIMDYRKDEGFRERDDESPCLISHGDSNGGIPVPMVMNLQKRDINRPAIKKRIDAGMKPNAGSGTIGKEDEAYCLDAGNNQGVARCLDSNMWKGITPEYYYEKKKRNVVACLTPYRIHKRQHGRRFKNEGEPMCTLTGQDIHGVKEYDKLRRLTPVECERLQGFPDFWTDICSDTQRYKQLGNAVSVPVIKAIGEKMYYEKIME
jgi:hypothetical protein